MSSVTLEIKGKHNTATCYTDELDESPMAYKSADAIIGAIAPTADIIMRIKPVYNFKAGE